VRVLLALLLDGPTGHERRFCDTRTGSRILSSEKGRLRLQISPATAHLWLIFATAVTLQRAATEPCLASPVL
jgi:hypothetical protein